LTDKHGFIKRQPVKKAAAPLALRQWPVLGDTDLNIEGYDLVKVDGWFEYWTDDSKLAKHLGEFLQLVKPGGTLMLDHTRAHAQSDFTRLVLGWLTMADRDLDRLHKNVLMPNADAIANVESWRLGDTARIIIITKKA
jgi:hypothetical protein